VQEAFLDGDARHSSRDLIGPIQILHRPHRRKTRNRSLKPLAD